jgi:hypothetical protein
MPAAYRKQLEHFVPHRGRHSFEGWDGQRMPTRRNHVRLPKALVSAVPMYRQNPLIPLADTLWDRCTERVHFLNK